MSDEPQTAMLLTEQEWQDLAEMARHVLVCCQGPACEHHANKPEGVRRRDLANRIIGAARHG